MSDSYDEPGSIHTATQRTSCPICGSKTSWRPALHKNGIEIVRCPACGVGRAMVENFVPTAVYTEGYFSGDCEGAYVDYLGSEAVLRREFSGQADFLARVVPSGKILEIGCAYGFFLQEALQRGFDVCGVEMAQAAVEHCQSSGLTGVEQGSVTADYLQRHGPFDAVVMLDVIEHIDDVAGVVNVVTTHIKHGGAVLITTGDWSSLFARLTGASWRLVAPPLHLWYFTPTSLEMMFLRAGFELSHMSHPWKLVPVDLAIAQAAKMIGLKSPQLPSRLNRLGLPANLFDSMRLVFRKI